MNTLPFVASKCSFIRSGITCSFPPGRCSRDNQPVENMSSGEAAAAAGDAEEVDAVGFAALAFASYNHIDERRW